MLSSEASVAIDLLSTIPFHQLRSLLQQMAQTMEMGLLIQSEDIGQVLDDSVTRLPSYFTLVLSRSFNALLQGEEIQPDGARGKATQGGNRETTYYRFQLTFDPEAIAAFLKTLTLHPTASRHPALQQAPKTLCPNHPRVQSEFTQRLIQILATDAGMIAPGINAVPVHPAFRQPAAAALREQIEQERLLNKLMTQVRQSLELPFILQTAVEQVRQFLQVDRMLIYQLLEPSTNAALARSPQAKPVSPQQLGFIAYEAIASEQIPSVLNLTTHDECFFQKADKRELYRQGYTLAIADIEKQYARIPCLMDFLQTAQVRSKLVAPIVVGGDLWGLLIAHQCQTQRHWKDSEQKFLQRIGEHLAIAISQAQLYAEIQQQKQTLEQRVIERTQELHDTLLAAQAASRAKSDFLAAVSHELRTPLTHVIGMSSTLLRWSTSDFDERQRRFLQIIRDSGEHLMELINDMLELSQLESGKAVLNLSEFSLSHLAQQCLKVVQDRAIAASITLELDLQVHPQYDQVTADPRRVRQILLNLLSNAIKFTPSGGTVMLRVFASTDSVIFQVKDTGIGIPEQQRSLLFQKFQQLDSSYHRQYEGTGLGLAMTKQLVELHGGRIDVESTVGVGSVFTVHLPLLETPTPAHSGNPDIALTPTLGRVMLIENHEESANVICDILNAAGYQLVWLLEGSMAMTQIEILQPIAVVISTRLPDIDSYTIIHQLRQNPVTKKIKVIALIDPNAPDDLERCLTAGANTYLNKPIRPDQVLYQLSRLMKEEG
ncbi:GAF domain-containing protein [Oscillatoria sp. FACHB-1407]|uniref:hybrid sensor histidine kinase/response regulator n=1 Tax=Oscillatoria sp. FACHB-1407 TaxID=2692847 RepID=UPI001684D36B|nr:ATP-binding protein [Oscillatoria sp. FACHB-1407]MBD2465135.1 GAF domain-containing protein [Oscillatoria sp. FACHB-1407]